MHHKKTILSQKVIKTCLQASIVVNAILYILITFKLSYLESNQRESVISNIGASVLQRTADKTIEQPQTQSSSSCASTILYYYASSSLIWLIIIFWKKRRRKVAAHLHGNNNTNHSSIQCSSVHNNYNVNHCKKYQYYSMV